MSYSVTIEQLLEAGAHFGHLTRRWNPKMNKYIFNEKNGIHIIDLRKTQILIDIAKQQVGNIASLGKVILFVGTKQQGKEIIEQQAKRCNMNYVTERWLGGMLTNFATIRKSIKRLNTIDKMEIDGTFEKLTKKERLLLTREKDRLRKVFGGIEDMTRLPGALLIGDIKKDHIAVKEEKNLGIPVISLVDTNCDPESVDFPIPANDDSMKTIDLIYKVMADAVLEGSELAKARAAELSADPERIAKESDSTDSEDAPKVQRRFRERKGKKDFRREPTQEQTKSDEVKEADAKNTETAPE